MENRQIIKEIIERLNALIVDVETPTKVVNYCRKFRVFLNKYDTELAHKQLEVNFTTSTTN